MQVAMAVAVASHVNLKALSLTPLHGRAESPERRIATAGAATRHVRTATGRIKDLESWSGLIRPASDRVALASGLPSLLPRPQAAG